MGILNKLYSFLTGKYHKKITDEYIVLPPYVTDSLKKCIYCGAKCFNYSCATCRITNTLHPNLWLVDRLKFISKLQLYINTYGIDTVNKALSSTNYNHIREDIYKLLALI